MTHVSYADAQAYAQWAGKELPTEAEWEYAARGGLDGAVFAWGDDETPGDRFMANTWQGVFPHENLCQDGFARTSPVGSFPANGYGLVDVCGNVWEWTCDDYSPNHEQRSSVGPTRRSCCGGASPRASETFKVVKGGSHLCAPNYCYRYRPAARQPQAADTSTSHVGIRCVLRP